MLQACNLADQTHNLATFRLKIMLLQTFVLLLPSYMLDISSLKSGNFKLAQNLTISHL
jgi:hypothetical protein